MKNAQGVSAIEANVPTLLDALADPVFVCHLNFGKMFGNILQANDAFYRITGKSRDAKDALNPLHVFDKSFESALDAVSEELLASGVSMFDSRLITMDGGLLPVEINASLFEYLGRLSVIAVVRSRAGRARAEIRLVEMQETLRNLALHLESIREEERRIIARELHDELGQHLTAIKIQMALLANKIPPEETQLHERGTRMLQLIDDSIPLLQKIVQQLRPVILDELGLAAAVEWQMEEFKKRTGIDYQLSLPKEELSELKSISTVIFRILQESLTNVARHSNASAVRVSVNESKGFISLVVHDNGKGITPSQIQSPHSLGLFGMKERVMPFGGTFEIKNSMRSGTMIIVSIPLTPPEPQKDL